MSRIAYYRVSTREQSIEAQRHALGGSFDKEYEDHAVSGSTTAKDRPGFSALLSYIREGDELHVVAVDRLGRDAIDVQANVRDLINKGVVVHVRGLGAISKGVGELVLAVLAQVAQMERDRISERCEAGRAAARDSLEKTGLTHRGKTSMGRPRIADADDVKKWRQENGASYSKTAAHFNISRPTAIRYCKSS